METSRTQAVDDAAEIGDYHSATTTALNTDIQHFTTSRCMVEVSPVKTVFESVVAILTLVRDQDGMTEERPFVELAELCSRTCRVLQAIDDLGGISETTEDLGRIVRRIESGIREWGDCARGLREQNLESIEECVVAWRAELCEIMSVLDGDSVRRSALGSSRDHEHTQNPFDLEPDSAPALVLPMSVPSVCDRRSQPPAVTDSGVPSSQQPGGVSHTPEPPLILTSDRRALQRLVSDNVPQDELPSLIETVVSNVKPIDIAKCLERSDDAQAFIDVTDQALETIDFAPRVRNKCVKSLYKMCAAHSLLPRSLHFELPGGTMGEVKYRCGSAEVLRRECSAGEVAIKALRPRNLSLEAMRKRFCKEVITWKALQHPNVLPLLGAIMTGNQFAMVSEWMTNGNIREFIASHQEENRFELLVDVTRGLMHMHGQGMIHGDLKGANILIDRTGHACLADFGLLTIASDATNIASSNSFLEGGTCRWMSPELFNPEKFGLKDSRPTKCSDCYALGMVVYEVLGGKVPFYRYGDYSVVAKVSEGERPERPQGASEPWFGDDIWNLLQHCWKPSPGDRPSIKDVLHRLEEVSVSWTPPAARLITDALTETSASWDPESSTEESIDEFEASSTSRVVSPQPPQGHRLEDFSGYRVPETTVKDLSGSGESEQILDRAQFSGTRSKGAPFRRRRTPSKYHTPDKSQAVGAEGWEQQNQALGSCTEKARSDVVAMKRRELSGGVEHLRALSRTMYEWEQPNYPRGRVV